MTGFSGTTNLSATPGCPACPSRASGWSSLTTSWGFPCCVRFPCVHAAATTPVQRLGVVFARVAQPCQPSPVPRPGLHIVLFEVCSAFTRVAACTLARSPYVVTAIRRLQTLRLLHACSGRFRLERLPGGACTHWKAPPLHGARHKLPLKTKAHFYSILTGFLPDVLKSILVEKTREAAKCYRHQSLIASTVVADSAFRLGSSRLSQSCWPPLHCKLQQHQKRQRADTSLV